MASQGVKQCMKTLENIYIIIIIIINIQKKTQPLRLYGHGFMAIWSEEEREREEERKITIMDACMHALSSMSMVYSFKVLFYFSKLVRICNSRSVNLLW